MSAIVWWLLPVAATLVAVVWAARASRPKPPVDAQTSIASYQRFQRAMQTPLESLPGQSRSVPESAPESAADLRPTDRPA
jgi:hypothetical protein